MADLPLPEDEAARYVLDQLGPAERHEFEARLEKSAELQALVRDLQAGTVALTMAAPRRRPPAEVWQGIQTAITEDARRKEATAVFWKTVRRQSGWWAAAACLIGWLFYAWRVEHHGSHSELSPLLSENNSHAD